MRRIIFITLVLIFAMITYSIASEFSAAMITIIGDNKNSGKIYVKNFDISRNEAMGMISITKRPIVYQLFEDTKKYVVTDIEKLKEKNPMVDVKNFKEWVEKNNMKKVGEESIEGFKCDIYEGEVKFAEAQPSVFMKLWYSEKLDYPIKSESTLPEPAGKISNHLENIKIETQPDSLFEIPPGYTEAKSIQEAMGMGDIQMPESPDAGQMPSPEEREKMMKQMQEMMKKMQKQ